MPKRYEDRYGRGTSGRERDRAHDRGYVDRATDEVRSWFGDDDAERRRHMDEQRDRTEGGGRGEWDRPARPRWQAGRRERPEYPQDWGRPDRPNWSREDWRREDWNRGAAMPWREASSGSAYGRDYDDRWDDSRHRREPTYGRDYDRAPDWQWSDRGRDWSERDRAGRGMSSQSPDWSARDRGWGGQAWDRDRAPSRSWSTDEGRTEFGSGHFGRGPKGYQRSDARIHEDVCDRLTYADVDAENIEVAVTNGEVTLSGTVHDRHDKRRAEDVVEDVSGVRDVHNNIRVHREDRGIGMSDKSGSEQPGAVLGVNPTAGAQIAHPQGGPKRS